MIHNENFTLTTQPFLKFPTFLSSILSPTTDRKTFHNNLPFCIIFYPTLPYSALSRPNDEKRTSTTLLQDFLWQPLHGIPNLPSKLVWVLITLHTSYLMPPLQLGLNPMTILQIIQYHVPSESLIQVLNEQPRTCLAPPNTTNFNTAAHAF